MPVYAQERAALVQGRAPGWLVAQQKLGPCSERHGQRQLALLSAAELRAERIQLVPERHFSCRAHNCCLRFSPSLTVATFITNQHITTAVGNTNTTGSIAAAGSGAAITAPAPQEVAPPAVATTAAAAVAAAAIVVPQPLDGGKQLKVLSHRQ